MSATKSTKKRAKSRAQNEVFQFDFQSKYDLPSPEQAQLRILFNMVIALIEAKFGTDGTNGKLTRTYKDQWRKCEHRVKEQHARKSKLVG